MEKFVLRLKCGSCDFKVVQPIKLNECGYYEFPQAVCPNDFMSLDGGIMKECQLTLDELLNFRK